MKIFLFILVIGVPCIGCRLFPSASVWILFNKVSIIICIVIFSCSSRPLLTQTHIDHYFYLASPLLVAEASYCRAIMTPILSTFIVGGNQIDWRKHTTFSKASIFWCTLQMWWLTFRLKIIGLGKRNINLRPKVEGY